MKFEEALAAMREGKTVRRHTRTVCYAIRNNVFHAFYTGNTSMHMRSFEATDILAEDWEVVQ